MMCLKLTIDLQLATTSIQCALRENDHSQTSLSYHYILVAHSLQVDKISEMETADIIALVSNCRYLVQLIIDQHVNCQ